ncbi:hypothetical protein [Paludisphaera sp.]|uniref:hypothetical protein n=1 Tax=Paludisphaera sp. TaxID=2017432 RepID=UPI00301C8FBF
MGDYLRLLTADAHDVPLAALQRAVPFGAVWSVDHPGMLGNYLAIGPEAEDLHHVWATVERNPVGPNTLGAEEVAEFIDSLEAGGPPSASRWLGEYMEGVREIYAIRLYAEAIRRRPEALDAVHAVRSALRDEVGGIGQWDGQGFTNEDDHLVWISASTALKGTVDAALLDESTGLWIPFDLDLDDPRARAAFLRGELPEPGRSAPED